MRRMLLSLLVFFFCTLSLVVAQDATVTDGSLSDSGNSIFQYSGEMLFTRLTDSGGIPPSNDSESAGDQIAEDSMMYGPLDPSQMMQSMADAGLVNGNLAFFMGKVVLLV